MRPLLYMRWVRPALLKFRGFIYDKHIYGSEAILSKVHVHCSKKHTNDPFLHYRLFDWKVFCNRMKNDSPPFGVNIFL